MKGPHMNTLRILSLALLASASCLAGTVETLVPRIINHQGQIAVAGAPFTGTGSYKFAFVDGTGVVLWANATADKSGVPSKAVSLTVANGLYSVQLGDTTITNMAAITFSAFDGTVAYLRVWFDDGVNGFQQLSPDQRLTATAYALKADALNGSVMTDESGNLSALGSISTAGGSYNFADATTQSTSCTGNSSPVSYVDVNTATDYSYTLKTDGSGNVYYFKIGSTFLGTLKVQLPSAQKTKGRRATVIRSLGAAATTINTASTNEKILVYYDSTFSGVYWTMQGLGCELISDGTNWLVIQFWE